MDEWEWHYNERRRRYEKRPIEQCPHCGEYDFVTVKRYDGPGITWRLLSKVGVVDAGETTETRQSYCDNCGLITDKREVSFDA